jgi:ADP-heptose:LPS heptosyltransferase
VDVQGNWKSAGVAFLSRAHRRSGFQRGDLREKSCAWVSNDPAPPWDDTTHKHAIDRSLHLAAHVCARSVQEVSEQLPKDWLQISAVERTTGRKRWREHMGEAPKRPVVLQLAAPGDVRAWPVHLQLTLLRELHNQGRDVLALSGPGEVKLGATIAKQLDDLPRLHHWVGQRSLRELAGAMRAGAEAGATLVSCDSGPLHMGTICGLRVIGLAGPQAAERTGPWPVPGPNSPHRVVRASTPLDCAPCLSRSCERSDGAQCMEQLTVNQVLEAIGRD